MCLMMEIRRLGFVWGACCAVAHAFPGAPPLVPPGIVKPIQNTTGLPTPTYTNSSCRASCTVELPAWSALSWIHTDQLEYTETITAATKIYSIDTASNFTLTRTQWNPLPKGYTAQALATNSEGTVYASHYVPDSTGFSSYTELVYPTPYFDYTDTYVWSGVLPTTDNTKSFCETALEPDTKLLSAHPQYPQPTGGKPDLSAPGGTDYTLIWMTPSKDPDHSFFLTAFPTISAFASCIPSPTTPPETPTRITTVLYITLTSTAYTTISGVPIIHTENTVSGFESSSSPPLKTVKPPATSTPQISKTPAKVIIESTVSGFEQYPPPVVTKPNIMYPGPQPPESTAESVHTENSVTGGFDEPSAGPGADESVGPRPSGNVRPGAAPTLTRAAQNQGSAPSLAPQGPAQTQTPGLADVILNVLTNPAVVSAVRAAGSSEGAPAAANTASTPIFTRIRTTIGGAETVVPGYVLPGGATATVGQTVTVNGAATVLAAPSTPVFTVIPTTVAGVVTSVPVYVLPDGRTATLGQTVTIKGSTTVLATPTASGVGNPGVGGPAKTSAGGGGVASNTPLQGGGGKVDVRWGTNLAAVGIIGFEMAGLW